MIDRVLIQDDLKRPFALKVDSDVVKRSNTIHFQMFLLGLQVLREGNQEPLSNWWMRSGKSVSFKKLP